MIFKKNNQRSLCVSMLVLSIALTALSSACRTPGSEPRVREGHLPNADAFGVLANPESYGEERTRMRISNIERAGNIVQADRDKSNFMVRTQIVLPESIDILLADNHDGVLLIRSRSDSQQLFQTTALYGNFELSDHIRIPTPSKQAALLKKYAEAIANLEN
jgi:hypothetical protein